MKPRAIVTAVLLAFVAASIGYFIVKEAGARPEQETAASTANRMGAGPRERSSAVSETRAEHPAIVIYYFHGNARCMTCRTIEAYAREAVETGFHEALKDGRLEWRVVNVEEPGNERYIQEFRLTTRSVVLERLSAGERRNWKNLHRVWELVRDKKTFLKYVQDETDAYLKAAGI